MRNESKLQIPISGKLKKNLTKKSESLGFSSVNELVRVILQDFVQNDTLLKFVSQKYPLELDAASEKRLAESMADYKAGRYETLSAKDPCAIDKWLEDLDV